MTRVQIVATIFTHIGKSRDKHEDAILIGSELFCSPMEEAKAIAASLRQPVVCAVADGLGGHRAGRVASCLVARRFAESGVNLRDERSVSGFLASLNTELFDAMSTDAEFVAMGSTVAGVVFTDPVVVYFNVGDSRAFREQHGFLRQLSVDDSREEAGSSCRVLTQSLGGSARPVEIMPHVGSEQLQPDRRYLLCSDGLTDMLSIDEMEACLSSDDYMSVTRLFDSAMAAGGADNISIILVRTGSDDAV